jgi:hypothetical protein
VTHDIACDDQLLASATSTIRISYNTNTSPHAHAHACCVYNVNVIAIVARQSHALSTAHMLQGLDHVLDMDSRAHIAAFGTTTHQCQRTRCMSRVRTVCISTGGCLVHVHAESLKALGCQVQLDQHRMCHYNATAASTSLLDSCRCHMDSVNASTTVPSMALT